MTETSKQLDASTVALKGLNWPVDGLTAGAQSGVQILPTKSEGGAQHNFEPTPTIPPAATRQDLEPTPINPEVVQPIEQSPQQSVDTLHSNPAPSAQQCVDTLHSNPEVSCQQPVDAKQSQSEGNKSWSLKEAADNLGISINTVRKRLQQGTLEGFKVDGPYGPEWRISPPSERSKPEETSVETPPAKFEGVSATVVEEESRGFIKPYEEPPSERLLKIVETQLELMGRLQSELAMKDRLLSEKEGQIKLLESKKPNPNWLQWLLGINPKD